MITDIREEVLQIVKDSLSISITIDCDGDISVKLYLDGKEISEDYLDTDDIIRRKRVVTS